MTYQEKINLYKEGKYLVPPPPVATGGWSIKNWIDFIDTYGKWIK